MTWRDTAVRCDNLSASYYMEDREMPDVSVWHRISRLLKVLLLLTAVAMIIGAFLPLQRDQRNERLKQAALQEQINAQRRLHDRYEREVKWLTYEPAYLEIFAREKYDLMKDGETVFRFDDAKSKPAFTPVIPAAPRRPN